MCELPDAVSNVVYFAIASWKWVSTLYIVQIFSKAFLLLNEVWFLFPESSHTLSPKPWYLSLVLCVRSFMTLMTFRERTVWAACLRIALEEGQRQSPALKENAPCHPHPYIFTENKPVRETGEKGFQVHKMRGSLGARGLSVSGWGWAGPALSANSKALPVRRTRLSSNLFSQGNHDTTTAIIIVYFLGTKSSLYIISVNPSTLLPWVEVILIFRIGKWRYHEIQWITKVTRVCGTRTFEEIYGTASVFPCSPPLTEVEKDEAGGNGEQALEALPRPMTGKSRLKGYAYSRWKKHCPHRERQKVGFHCRLANHWLFYPWDRQGRKRKGPGMIYSHDTTFIYKRTLGV